MNPRLRAMLLAAATVVIGGTSYNLYVRDPPGRAIADLRDAGLLSERSGRWVLACTEKTTVATARYLKRAGYGDVKPGSVRRVARVVIEHDGGEIVNASQDVGAPNDADGGDEEDETDDALTVTRRGCERLECNALPAELRILSDGGFRHERADGGEAPWCNSAVRRGLLTPPCAIPNCFTRPDGGWDDDSAPVDCRFGPPYSASPVWRGCNVGIGTAAVGTACLPVSCEVVAGDPIEVLF